MGTPISWDFQEFSVTYVVFLVFKDHWSVANELSMIKLSHSGYTMCMQLIAMETFDAILPENKILTIIIIAAHGGFPP